MLDVIRIEEIVGEVARANLHDTKLERIFTETAIDSEGKDALRITLVLDQDAVRNVTGDQALGLLVGVQKELYDAGEERFPIVEYATEQELEADEEDV